MKRTTKIRLEPCDAGFYRDWREVTPREPQQSHHDHGVTAFSLYQLLSETFRGEFDRLKLFVLDPYDLAPSKLTRNLDIDVEDVKRLARSKNPTSICSRLAIGTNSDPTLRVRSNATT